MKRLVIPLMVSLLIALTAGLASGQVFIDTDKIGFKDTVRALPDSFVWIPIHLTTDSAVSGISMNFAFDHTILQPVIGNDAFDPGTQDSVDVVWYINVRFTNETRGYLGTENTDVIVVVPYYLDKRDTSRFLLYPWGNIRTIPGGLGEDYYVAEMQFKVNPSSSLFDESPLNVFRQAAEYQMTELAEEWYVPDGDPLTTDTITKAVWPSMLSSTFVVDTADAGSGPSPDENDLPVVATISPNVYNIKQGELVSFSVTATDAELGELSLWANQSSGLPANAALAPSNPVIGAGGVATGTFSFKPDITQEGNFVFTFSAVDDSGAVSSPNQIVTVMVEALEFDVLFTTSAEGISPEGGIPGLDEVMVPINIVTKKEIYGIQFDMNYDADNFELDSIVKSDRIPDWVTYENIGANPGEVRIMTFGLANDPMVAGSTSAVLYLAFTVDEFAEAGCYPLVLFNALESIDPDPAIPSLELQSESGILCVDILGDVNLNGQVEVDDAVGVVGYIIGNFELSRRRFAIADIVVNDTVNVIDLVGIINTIFGLPVSPKPAATPDILDEFATLRIVHDEIPGAGISSEMKILADLPTEAAGVELDIYYNTNTVDMLEPRLADGSEGFIIRHRDNGAGHLKVLLFNWSPWDPDKLIAEGLSEIVELPFVSKTQIRATDGEQVKITRAFISTGSARAIAIEGLGPGPLPDKFILYQNRPNPFNPVTTIDFYIDGQSASGYEFVKLEIFNILGQAVKTLIDEPLPPGLHSVVWDGTDDKNARVATGVYLYRLKLDDASQTKKMVLLK